MGLLLEIPVKGDDAAMHPFVLGAFSSLLTIVLAWRPVRQLPSSDKRTPWGCKLYLWEWVKQKDRGNLGPWWHGRTQTSPELRISGLNFQEKTFNPRGLKSLWPCRPRALASPGRLLERLTLRPLLKPTESEPVFEQNPQGFACTLTLEKQWPRCS